jgi:hypothetical protein
VRFFHTCGTNQNGEIGVCVCSRQTAQRSLNSPDSDSDSQILESKPKLGFTFLGPTNRTGPQCAEVSDVVLLCVALLVLSRFRRRYVSKKGHQILEVSLAARVLVQSVDIVLPSLVTLSLV